MIKRRRFVQQDVLEERLTAEAKSLRIEAKTLSPGVEKEALLKKARQADVAAHMSEWLRSPGLRCPE
ncbi:hypothetical protein IC762_18325 [Bradyrhizobium genosp. L]|nr:hypothetical protein [Bradyrhizobium genosp. L]QPF88156.1 hypothetical protein IC762_18325 [Bradyrhizobium genosp. L]